MIEKARLRQFLKPDPISYREIEERDHEAILELFGQPKCLKGMVTEPFRTTDDIKAWLDSQGEASATTVATSNDRAIGIALLAPGQEFRRHVGGLVLFVHDDFHRKGIGERLLKILIATADRRFKLRRLELWVLCENAPAIDLYEKYGFEIEGRHNAFAIRGGEVVDVFTMARLLDNPIEVTVHETQAAGAPDGLEREA